MIHKGNKYQINIEHAKVKGDNDWINGLDWYRPAVLNLLWAAKKLLQPSFVW